MQASTSTMGEIILFADIYLQKVETNDNILTFRRQI
jgi:hypothetical protein